MMVRTWMCANFRWTSAYGKLSSWILKKTYTQFGKRKNSRIPGTCANRDSTRIPSLTHGLNTKIIPTWTKTMKKLTLRIIWPSNGRIWTCIAGVRSIARFERSGSLGQVIASCLFPFISVAGPVVIGPHGHQPHHQRTSKVPCLQLFFVWHVAFSGSVAPEKWANN